MEKDWIGPFIRQFPEVDWVRDEPMSRHTTFRIGGGAQLFASPTVEQAAAILAGCRAQHIPVTVLGNGSNVLVGDRGIPGVVLVFGKQASKILVSDSAAKQEDGGTEASSGSLLFTAEAGALLSRTACLAAEYGCTGMEFAAGIPGTVGGALLMNAGAYGSEMKDVVKEACVLLPDGTRQVWQKEEMELSYRHSRMMETGAVILSAVFELFLGNAAEIQEKMQQLRKRRAEKQPLEYPSAGSTFRRPSGHFAGKLIMDAGLRGYSVGDAAVSEKHCGFVINKGHATAADVRTLMEDVTERIEAEFGVSLEPEVKFLGEF